MISNDMNAYWRRDSKYYREPRTTEDKAEQQRLFEQAQAVGEWEKAHRVPDIKRMTWWYSDFGVYVPNDFVTPEQLSARYSEIDSVKERASKKLDSVEENAAMPNQLPSKESVARLREQYPERTRVELVSMDDPYSTLVPGDKGSVSFIDDIGTIFMNWDKGSSLGLV